MPRLQSLGSASSSSARDASRAFGIAAVAASRRADCCSSVSDSKASLPMTITSGRGHRFTFAVTYFARLS